MDDPLVISHRKKKETQQTSFDQKRKTKRTYKINKAKHERKKGTETDRKQKEEKERERKRNPTKKRKTNKTKKEKRKKTESWTKKKEKNSTPDFE